MPLNFFLIEDNWWWALNREVIEVALKSLTLLLRRSVRKKFKLIGEGGTYERGSPLNNGETSII